MQLRHVHFMGLVSKVTVMHWLKAADCALFVVKDVPFLSTASPNKLFDAFAAGVPVIQATEGWIRDLFEREKCGVNVPANDLPAMAAAIERLTADAEFRASVSRNARRVANELFDRDLLATRMRGILAMSAGMPA
jgi:glycosyltransferase involved in cell wall biosynthesis